MNNSPIKPTGNGGSPAFRLDKTYGKIFGVCGGIANYTGIDPIWIRIGFVVGAFVSLGTAALVYGAIALIAD
ncbi:PspC domain-containing protein [Altererythrobacter sp. GH1-8]|uniref:PspC domain-containing protein n=1 Tax=Altererythrobacter sp. GH1-8 TaxID=3349333 RepID=UPI00374DA297